GFPGKDATLLLEGCPPLGLIPARARKTFKPQSVLWQLPAHLVGPYAETDAVRTLELFESLDPVLDREDTRDAYRVEIDLLPMVHAMRRRGIRVDIAAVERARKLLLQKRDVVLIQIGALLGSTVSMTEIRGRTWLIATFDRAGIAYPRTAKGNPSFKGGTTGWMRQSTHPLPPLIAAADRLDNYAEINPHRSDTGGARSLRFSYAHPPLQQMPKHDTELAPLVRAPFLPEDGEGGAGGGISQPEFRLVTHYTAPPNLPPPH